MSRVLFLLLALGWVSSARAVEIGQTWDEVQAELGKPVNKLDGPKRSIGCWENMEIAFVDGRVESVVRRDFASEAASEARRKQATEDARKLREEAEAESRRLEQERADQAEKDAPERELKIQAGKIAALEAELEIERAKLQKLTLQFESQKAKDRSARQLMLRKEISSLQVEVQRALADGETQRAARLQNDLRAKDRELKALSR